MRSTGARGRATGRRRPVIALRLSSVLVGGLVALSLIAGRLVQLQGVDRAAYTSDAVRQRLHTVTLTAARGQILDASGSPLAETVAADDVYADPSQVPAAEAPDIAGRLAQVLGVPSATLLTKLTGTGSFAYLDRAVTPQLGSAVMALGLPGIGILATSRRVYPDGPLAASVLGVVGTDGTGLAGLELANNRLLAGHDGERTYEAGSAGDPIPDGTTTVVPAVPGSTLQLTLDSDLQYEAEQAVQAQVRASHAASGTVVVLQPSTGRILALATTPGFNPNQLGSLTAESLADPAVQDVYEPGSVNKVITMSAALQEGAVTPTTRFVVPNTYRDAGATFHDAENHATEHLTTTGVLAQSSNIGTIQVANRIGAATLDSYLRAYGFGQPTGVGLPGDSDGLLPPLSEWSATTLPTVAFGQGIGVTALQVASVYATIANGGVRVAPTLVAATIDAKGVRHPAAAPARRRVVSAAVATQTRRMLESVVSNEGTAPKAEIPGYRVAGKTGTAQVPDGRGGYLAGAYTASFVGMAPADDPQLVVEAVIQEPRVGSHFGGDVAAPVFRQVMAFALAELGIPPTRTRVSPYPLTWSAR